jgi:hypothetical protein
METEHHPIITAAMDLIGVDAGNMVLKHGGPSTRPLLIILRHHLLLDRRPDVEVPPVLIDIGEEIIIEMADIFLPAHKATGMPRSEIEVTQHGKGMIHRIPNKGSQVTQDHRVQVEEDNGPFQSVKFPFRPPPGPSMKKRDRIHSRDTNIR